MILVDTSVWVLRLIIDLNHLMGKGLGYVDVHLSASALLARAPIWSYDKRLNAANEMLGIRYDPVSFR